jgi:hypothetical protein
MEHMWRVWLVMPMIVNLGIHLSADAPKTHAFVFAARVEPMRFFNV